MKLEVEMTREEAHLLLTLIVDIPLKEPEVEDILGKIMTALDNLLAKKVST